MGITYDPTKPAANDKPANDQAPMQTNFASIKTLIDVDHIDFSNAQYGQHSQVTLASNLPPTFPTSFPIIFRNNQDGAASPNTLPLPAPFVALGNGSFNSKTQNITAPSGSIILFGGVIMKWGSYTLAPGVVSAAVSFASAFPNAVWSITSGSNVSGSANDGPRIISINVGRDGFVGGRINSSSPLGGTYTYYYTAIGN